MPKKKNKFETAERGRKLAYLFFELGRKLETTERSMDMEVAHI